MELPNGQIPKIAWAEKKTTKTKMAQTKNSKFLYIKFFNLVFNIRETLNNYTLKVDISQSQRREKILNIKDYDNNICKNRLIFHNRI